MRNSLEVILKQDFPEYFAGTEKSLQQSLMKFGCCCEDGWFDIIYRCCLELKKNNLHVEFVQIKQKFGTLRLYYNCTKHNNEFTGRLNTKLHPITNKLCQLVCHLVSYLPKNTERSKIYQHVWQFKNLFHEYILQDEHCKISHIVDKYCHLSQCTCEICGKPGKCRSTKNKWLYTVCEDCHEVQNAFEKD
jgi:hypothetical protein